VEKRKHFAATGWGSAVIWLHWAMALLLLLVFGSGYAAEHFSRGPRQQALYEVHFSLGLLTLLLALFRAAVRLASGAPARAAGAAFQRWASATVHGLLYLTMFSALASGWVNFMFLGPVRIFGLVDVPRLFDPETQEPLRALSWYVHFYSYLILLPLVALHVAAALYHHFVLRDRLLLDFLPRPR
jgi:cytochrome b561